METLLKQTTAYRLLQNEARADRLANTYLLLFNDDRNLRFALKQFAKLFFDGSERTNGRIDRENHPDCLFFPEEGKAIDRDVAAAISEESCLGAVEGSRKVFVLDNFHRASAVVQNKLLKLLEEPPAGVYFLLGATVEFPLLATVKSRASKLEIPPFSEEQVAACLQRIYPTCNNAALYASASEGMVGRAQTLLADGDYAELRRKIFACAAANSANIPSVSRALNGVKEKGEAISLLRRTYRDMLFYRTGQPYGGELPEDLKKAATEFSPQTLIFALDVFAEAEKQLSFNANLAQCVEVGLWKIDKEKRKCKK